MIVAVYLAEVTPSQIRGRIEILSCLSLTYGSLLAYILCLLFREKWRVLILLGIISPILTLIV